MLILTGLVLCAAGGWLLRHHRAPPSAATPSAAAPVSVATAASADLDVFASGLGTVTPFNTVSVRTQINGRLQSVGFAEGQAVHRGDLLAQIDPRPYQAALAQYQGQLARDGASLHEAQSDSSRYQTLLRQDSVSRQTAQDQVFVIQQDQGAVRSDQAQIDAQTLNIEYCRIVAPIDGRVGLRTVDPGNYVQTSDGTAIAVVTQVQPISVVFALPEDELPAVVPRFHGGTPMPVAAFDRSNRTKLADGVLVAIDNTVDPTTGTWKLRASFANPDEALFPDQFVNARLLVRSLRGVLTVPEAAVQHGAPGTYVFRLRPGSHTVAVTPIAMGVTQGGRVEVTSGLTAGDQVVTGGADQLSDGAPVTLQAGPAR